MEITYNVEIRNINNEIIKSRMSNNFPTNFIKSYRDISVLDHVIINQYVKDLSENYVIVKKRSFNNKLLHIIERFNLFNDLKKHLDDLEANDCLWTKLSNVKAGNKIKINNRWLTISNIRIIKNNCNIITNIIIKTYDLVEGEHEWEFTVELLKSKIRKQ